MRFVCRRTASAIFQGIRTVDFIPVIDGVRLLTARGRSVQTAGQERLWPALWDTGGVISVIPREFVEELHYPPSGRTRPLRAFDGRAEPFLWYHVLIGLPGLPLFRARAVAPPDREPRTPRRHITLGCDILSRMTVRCDSTLPWDIDHPLEAGTSWTWDYEKTP